MKRYASLIAAALLATNTWAQMRFTFTGMEVTETVLPDGTMLVELPKGTDLNSFAELGMAATVDGEPVALDAITPNPSTTFITDSEIETFVYDGKAYSFRFTADAYTSYLFAYFNGNAQWQEQICFALSDDGFTYTPLNGGDPIIS